MVDCKTPQLISVLVLFGLFSLSAFSQTPHSTDDSEIRGMLMNQPDYAATRQFGFMEPKGGFGSTTKVAKLGARVRAEDDDRITIEEAGKPTIRIYPKRREFAEAAPDPEANQDGEFAVTAEELAKRQDVSFKLLGTDKTGEYECQKIEATYKDKRLESVKFVFCCAPALKNLVVFQQTFLGPVTMTTILTNVSLKVSPELFRIPAGYKKVQEKSYDEQFKELIDQIKPTPSPKPIQ